MNKVWPTAPEGTAALSTNNDPANDIQTKTQVYPGDDIVITDITDIMYPETEAANNNHTSNSNYHSNVNADTTLNTEIEVSNDTNELDENVHTVDTYLTDTINLDTEAPKKGSQVHADAAMSSKTEMSNYISEITSEEANIYNSTIDTIYSDTDAANINQALTNKVYPENDAGAAVISETEIYNDVSEVPPNDDIIITEPIDMTFSGTEMYDYTSEVILNDDLTITDLADIHPEIETSNGNHASDSEIDAYAAIVPEYETPNNIFEVYANDDTVITNLTDAVDLETEESNYDAPESQVQVGNDTDAVANGFDASKTANKVVADDSKDSVSQNYLHPY